MARRQLPELEYGHWTKRERQVLDLIADGRTNGEIAERLGISFPTAKWHVSEVITKLGVSSREEVADYWRAARSPRTRIQNGLRAALPASALAKLSIGAALTTVAAVGVVLYAGVHSLARDTPAQTEGGLEQDDVRIVVLEVEANALETSVRLAVEGRDDWGETLASTGRVQLIDGAGNGHWVLRSLGDPAALRVQTFVFSAVPEGPAVVVIDELTFESLADRTARLSAIARGIPASLTGGRRVTGRWSANLTVQRSGPETVEFVPVGGIAPYGPGSLVIERVLLTGGTVQVEGRVEGLPPDAFQDLLLAPASLRLDGRDAEFVGGRGGFGDGNARFELRFRVDGSGVAELRVPFNVSGVNLPGEAHWPETAAVLGPHAGTTAAISLELPATGLAATSPAPSGTPR